MLDTAVDEMVDRGVNRRSACKALGRPHASHYRAKQAPLHGPPAPRPRPGRALTDTETTEVVEVLCGIRPATQMIRWMAYDVHTALARRAAVAARVRRQSRNARPPMVRAVRVFSPREGAVEASAVILDNDRVRAIAMRMEALDHRWRVTALEIG